MFRFISILFFRSKLSLLNYSSKAWILKIFGATIGDNLVIKRDVKGLYKKYYEGLEKHVVGLDIPWHAPKNFDLKIYEHKF